MRGDFAKERVSLRVGISEVLILDFLRPGMYRARDVLKYTLRRRPTCLSPAGQTERR
jgi:hypothetical protein